MESKEDNSSNLTRWAETMKRTVKNTTSKLHLAKDNVNLRRYR